MEHSGETRWPRRRLLVSGASLLGTGWVLGSVGLLSGCGEDKGKVAQIENPVDPAKTPGGMDSMNFFKSQHLDKSGKAKEKK